MVKATWRILALSALMGATALPVSAQVVIGGSGQPSVEVNWAVLESLGRQPTLADMLKNDMAVKPATSSTKLPGQQRAVAYKPYKSAVAKKAVAEPTKTKAIPAAAKAEPAMANLVRAAQKPEPAMEPAKTEAPKAEPAATPPAPQVAAAPKPTETAKPAVPQVSLPEIAKPTSIAKVEPPTPAPAAKTETPKPVAAPIPAKVEPASAPIPLTAAPSAPAAKPEPVPAPQVAALPPASVVSAKGDSLSLMFGNDDAKLPAGAQSDLQALAKRMEKDEGLGLQLLAYASGDEAGASKARRLSLSRALEVRKFLMEQGVRSTRIEVRALGNKLEGAGPADRVDAVLVSR